jgi:predicted nuclease of predicted toxin-antitoxin system
VRILLDQGTPVPLRRALAGHTVATAYEEGWATLTNGELLAAAEGSFDVLVTTDQNLSYQQNLAGRRLAILVLLTANWLRLRQHSAVIAAAVESLRPGELRELSFPS